MKLHRANTRIKIGRPLGVSLRPVKFHLECDTLILSMLSHSSGVTSQHFYSTYTTFMVDLAHFFYPELHSPDGVGILFAKLEKGLLESKGGISKLFWKK